MMTMTPREVAQYHANTQKMLFTDASMRYCTGCKKRRSLAQFWDSKRNPTHEKCRVCRGLK